MKKLLSICLMCAMLCAAALTSALAETTFVPPQDGDPLTMEADLGLLVDGVWYPILNDFAALKAVLGDPMETLTAPSCVYKGDDKEFVYDGLEIFTNPLGEMDVWFDAYITGGDTVTTRGIGVGSRLEEVIQAYGENYYSEGAGMITYSLSGDPEDYASPCILFTLEDDVVTIIDIYYPTNTN